MSASDCRPGRGSAVQEGKGPFLYEAQIDAYLSLRRDWLTSVFIARRRALKQIFQLFEIATTVRGGFDLIKN